MPKFFRHTQDMNAYQQGVSAVIGIDCNVGTPDHLFHPSNYRERLPEDYVSRKLSTRAVAELLNVTEDSVRLWARQGKLPGRKFGNRTGWKKVVMWRFSLKDVEDFILSGQIRRDLSNPIEHKTWTSQEEALCQQGICPEGRSRRAYHIKRHRLRKDGKLNGKQDA